MDSRQIPSAEEKAAFYRSKIKAQKKFVEETGPFSLFFESIPEEIALAILIGSKQVEALPEDFPPDAMPHAPIHQAAFLLRDNIRIRGFGGGLDEAYAYLAKLIYIDRLAPSAIEFHQTEIPKTRAAQAEKLCLTALQYKKDSIAALIVLAGLLEKKVISGSNEYLPAKELDATPEQQAIYIYKSILKTGDCKVSKCGLARLKAHAESKSTITKELLANKLIVDINIFKQSPLITHFEDVATPQFHDEEDETLAPKFS